MKLRTRSWLCREEIDRERLLDMEQRLGPRRVVSMAILGVALLAAGPWLGFWTIIPLLGSGLFFAVMSRHTTRAARPEYLMASAWVAAQLAIAISVALTGGPRSPAVGWLVIPVVTRGARFSGRGVAAGVGLTAVLIAATTLGVDPVWVWHHPADALFPVAMLAATAVLSTALMGSDLAHRSASIIDPLTSMLNRASLNARAAELAAQAAIVQQPIGLVVGDLDCFKAINDTHGHPIGDAVLRDVAYRIRRELRAYDLAYRIGGEEFVVLMPGASARRSAEVAENLRRAVAAETVAGISVTMSFGVAAAPPGTFDYAETFAAADAALYEAKARGRDQVVGAGLSTGAVGIA
jgi:diguanylate cyclase (GGDEF)-like protein